MQGQGVQVKPGDRVTIHGLRAKPELNGQSAVLVGPAQNGRVNVRLDSGQEIALKQENLGIQAPGGGGMGSGMGGGMPGFGGGMPGMPGMGGMPDPQVIIEQVGARLRQAFASTGFNVPPGVSPQQLVLGSVIGSLIGLYILTRFLSMTVLAIVAVTAYWAMATDSGSMAMNQCCAKISGVLRMPVRKHTLVFVICLGVAALGHTILGTRAASTLSRDGAVPQDTALTNAIRDAYEQGYEDGRDGLEKRPPRHLPSQSYAPPPPRSSSSGFGVSSIFKYGMAGYLVYKLGKTPSGWTPQVAMMNAKANPLQVILMVVMLSGVLF